MNLTLLLLLSYILILVLIILIVGLVLRTSKLEKKLVNMSPQDVMALVQQMRDMVIESERVADSLDQSIKEKEGILEDLADLVDARLDRYETIVQDAPQELSLRERILQAHKAGKAPIDIARELQISVTEVQIVINISRG